MDYSEQFCTAVDTIVAERLNALQFDKTILCKVVEVVDKNAGEYIVKDDLSNFTAYSSGASYKKNDQVYVTIPKGDYSQQKLIVGKYSKNKQESWQSDMQKFIPVTENLFTDNDIELSLVANGDIENSVAYIYEAEAFSNLIPSNLTHLAVSAEFFADLKTALDGEYGLRIFLKTDKKGYVIDLSNEMMFGNPYNNFSFLTQERVFDLKSVDGDIVKIEVLLYQNGNFTFKNNLNNQSTSQQIKVKNISIKAGYNSQDFNSDTVILYTANDTNYYLDENQQSYRKEIKLKWNRDHEGNIVNITDKEHLGKNTIRWYIRANDAQKNIGTSTSENMVEDWTEIEGEKDNFTYNLDINVVNYKYEIKAIITNEEDSTIELESNVITFNRVDTSSGELKVSLYKIKDGQAFNTNNKIEYGSSEISYFWNISLFKNGTFANINKKNLTVKVFGTSNKFLKDKWNNVEYGLSANSNFSTIENDSNWIESERFTPEGLSDNKIFNDSYVYKFTLNDNGTVYETIVTLFITKNLDYSTNLMNNNFILYNEYGVLVEPNISALLENYDNNYNVVFHEEESVFTVFEDTKIHCPEHYIWGENPVKLIKFIEPSGEENQIVLASYALILKQDKYDQNDEYTWKIMATSGTDAETYINLVDFVNNSTVSHTMLQLSGGKDLKDFVEGDNTTKTGYAVRVNYFGVVIDDPIAFTSNSTIWTDDGDGLTAPINGSLLYESGSSTDSWINAHLKKGDIVIFESGKIRKVGYDINKLNSWLGQGEMNEKGQFSGVYIGELNGTSGIYGFKNGVIETEINKNGINFGRWNIETNHLDTNPTPHGKFNRTWGTWTYIVPDSWTPPDDVHDNVSLKNINDGERTVLYSAIRSSDYTGDYNDKTKKDNTYTIATMDLEIWEKDSINGKEEQKIDKEIVKYNVVGTTPMPYYVKFQAEPTGSFFGIRGGASPGDFLAFSQNGTGAWQGSVGYQKWFVYLNDIFGIYKTESGEKKGVLRSTDLHSCYTIDGVAVSSDQRLKINIKSYENDKFDKFYDGLLPKNYNLKDSLNKITNGFIAQDILKLYESIGIKKDEQTLVRENQDGILSLNYSEFIPLNTWQIQKLKNRVFDLETKIQMLEDEVKELKNDIK